MSTTRTRERGSGRFRSIAIVSGKGGSGKTLVAAALAQSAAAEGQRVVLIDADLGTGGLTYYLGFSAFERAREGFTEYLLGGGRALPKVAKAKAEVSISDPAMKRVGLIPIGEHRNLDGKAKGVNSDIILTLNERLKTEYDLAIYDCRGGLDEDSISVCRSTHEILMVVETDAASIQASQYLSGKLYEAGFGGKISGFILNKVMDDPTSLAKAGTSFFKAEYLGAIPFDIDTTRDFIKGNLPSSGSIFYRAIAAAVLPILGIKGVVSKYRSLRANEFSKLTLKDSDEFEGGIFLAVFATYGVIIFGIIVFWMRKSLDQFEQFSVSLAGLLFVFAALSPPLKRSLGRLMSGYVGWARAALGGKR